MTQPPEPSWVAPTRGRTRWLVTALVGVTAVGIWLGLPPAPPSSASGWDGPEGIETWCWGDLPYDACMERAEAVLRRHREVSGAEPVVQIEIDDVRGDRTCRDAGDGWQTCGVPGSPVPLG